jgi:hypothetical protein
LGTLKLTGDMATPAALSVIALFDGSAAGLFDGLPGSASGAL